MEILKEKITLIKQDGNSKKISDVEIISSDKLKSQIGLDALYLIDCDLDSVLCIGKYEVADLTNILSTDGFSFSELLPVVALDTEGKILMQAFLNLEALSETFRTGYANYFSRSRGKIWLKGESSDHKQEILRVEYSKNHFFVYVVRQSIAACHEGFYSCFYRKLEPDGSFTQIDFDRKFLPQKVYG